MRMRRARQAHCRSNSIPFLPGSAEMAPAATDTLRQLAAALEQRPRLDMRVRPSYDLAADRDAIAEQQVRLHIALATSASTGDRASAAVPDFGNPRVRDILDEFAGERLPEAQRRAIARGVDDFYVAARPVPDGDLYLALVANEPVSGTVLRRLARFRARSVIDALERHGIDRTRFGISDALDTTETGAGTVPVKLEVHARPAPVAG